MVGIDIFLDVFVLECCLCWSIVLFCIFVYLLFWNWCVVCVKVFVVVFDWIHIDRFWDKLYDFGFLLCFVMCWKICFRFLSLVPVYDLFWFILWTWSFLWLSVEFFILVLIWYTRNLFLLVGIVCEVESLRSAKCSLFAGTFSFWIGRDRIFEFILSYPLYVSYLCRYFFLFYHECYCDRFFNTATATKSPFCSFIQSWVTRWSI